VRHLSPLANTYGILLNTHCYVDSNPLSSLEQLLAGEYHTDRYVMKFHQTVLSDDTSERFDEDENSSKRARAKKLYQQNKLSLFIHWGLYSLLASTYQNQFYYGISEWIMHRQMANIPLQEYKTYAASTTPLQLDQNPYDFI